MVLLQKLAPAKVTFAKNKYILSPKIQSSNIHSTRNQRNFLPKGHENSQQSENSILLYPKVYFLSNPDERDLWIWCEQPNWQHHNFNKTSEMFRPKIHQIISTINNFTKRFLIKVHYLRNKRIGGLHDPAIILFRITARWRIGKVISCFILFWWFTSKSLNNFGWHWSENVHFELQWLFVSLILMAQSRMARKEHQRPPT